MGETGVYRKAAAAVGVLALAGLARASALTPSAPVESATVELATAQAAPAATSTTTASTTAGGAAPRATTTTANSALRPTTTSTSTTTSPSTTTTSTTAAPPPARPAFQDDFSSASLDRSKWTTCYPWGTPAGCTNAGNHEQEWYVPSQVQQSGGALHLVADRRDTDGTDRNGNATVFPYRSGMVTTAHRFEFTYGRVEFTAKVPKGQAMWPALWLLPTDYSWPPEVDLMEAVGQDTTGIAVTLHGTDGSKAQKYVGGADFAAGWHTFAIDWQPGSITWLVDGKAAMTATHGVPSRPMYLLANLAVGGSGGGPIGAGTPDHASFDIDSVQVWTR